MMMTLMIFDAAAIGSEMPFEGIEFEGWLLLDGWDGMGRNGRLTRDGVVWSDGLVL